MKPEPIRVEELLFSHQDLEVLQLAKNFSQDTDQDEWIDDDVVLMSCANVRADPERMSTNCFIAYEGSAPIGFLVGVTFQPFHRRGIVASQIFCYVEPRARGGLAVRRMHQALDKWAQLNGATQIHTSTTNSRYAARTSKLFEKLGYRRVGSTHMKEIAYGNAG